MELYTLMETFYKRHRFDETLMSCSACGVREQESETSKYQSVVVRTLPKIYVFTLNATNKATEVKGHWETVYIEWN